MPPWAMPYVRRCCRDTTNSTRPRPLPASIKRICKRSRRGISGNLLGAFEPAGSLDELELGTNGDPSGWKGWRRLQDNDLREVAENRPILSNRERETTDPFLIASHAYNSSALGRPGRSGPIASRFGRGPLAGHRADGTSLALGSTAPKSTVGFGFLPFRVHSCYGDTSQRRSVP
jgi:hypothetical protein